MVTVLQVLPATRYHHTMPPYDRTQYQCYVLPYITYVVRARSTCYVLPLAEPSNIGCLQGADTLATGFSVKRHAGYPSLPDRRTSTMYSFQGQTLSSMGESFFSLVPGM